jgi:hypothetical protein
MLAELGHSEKAMEYCDALARELHGADMSLLSTFRVEYVTLLNELATRLRFFNLYAASQSSMSDFWVNEACFFSLCDFDLSWLCRCLL